VRNVDSLGSEFTSERLAEGAHGELAGGEGGAEGGTFKGGCCAGEDEGRRVLWRRGGLNGLKEEGKGGLGEQEGAFAV